MTVLARSSYNVENTKKATTGYVYSLIHSKADKMFFLRQHNTKQI